VLIGPPYGSLDPVPTFVGRRPWLAVPALRVISLTLVLLHLIRHGASATNPTTPAHDWPLNDSARSGIEELRDSGALPVGAQWFSSPEPKALETARLLYSGEAQVVDDLREAERSPVWFDVTSEFESTVARAFAKPDLVVVPGWEPLARTRSRVTRAARALLAAAAPASDVVMIGHGTAWTLLIAELTATEVDVASWRSILMPDQCAIDVDCGRLFSGWGDWRSE
jgi:broad specificity phosphatase PhoE